MDYYSGDIARGASNTKDGLFSTEFWNPSDAAFKMRRGSTEIYFVNLKTFGRTAVFVKEPGNPAYEIP